MKELKREKDVFKGSEVAKKNVVRMQTSLNVSINLRIS